ncbi:MAG TPA: class I SAM-dependent methyltransferase [Anaerolineae bacterium]
MGGLNLRKRIFAWSMSGRQGEYESVLAEYKRRLFAGLRGTVMEIGPGSGVNLAYLLPNPELHWIGIEPNPYMQRYLLEQAARLGMPKPDLRTGTAERMDAADQSADAVVGTQVLCSVADQQAALREVLRVLKPGGRFIFIEHVAAPQGSRQRARQNLITPLWQFVADGCHPNRETWAALQAAGFAQVDFERFMLRLPIVGPHIAGVAKK